MISVDFGPISETVYIDANPAILTYIYIYGVDVVEWSRALDVRLSEWCCSVSMV
jgi:hypothetical protein